MKKILSLSISFLLLLSVVNLRADLLWHDNSVGYYAGQTVTNEAIDLKGTVTFYGNTFIQATGGNELVITATNNDVTLKPADDPEWYGILYLWADTVDDTITFSCTQNLTTVGAQSGGNYLDFLISFSGNGTLDFYNAGGTKVSFNQGDSENDGATFFVVCADSPGGTKPFLMFDRMDGVGDDDDVEVEIGPNSLVSFIDTTSVTAGTTGAAEIRFDAASNGLGNMILRVQDTGCFDMSGHQLQKEVGGNWVAAPDFNFDFGKSNIAWWNPAGSELDVRVFNGWFTEQQSKEGTNRLLVINQNKTWGQLSADPFGTGDFFAYPDGGAKYGFVLGSNAIFYIDNDIYVDYVGTTTNIIPPNVDSTTLDGRTKTAVVKERNASAFIVDGLTFSANDVYKAQVQVAPRGGLFFRSAADSEGNGNWTAPVGPDWAYSFTIDPDKQIDGPGNIVFDVSYDCKITNTWDSWGGAVGIFGKQMSVSGGELYPDSSFAVDFTDFIYPQPTFAKYASPDERFLQYAKACCFVNGELNVDNTNWVHWGGLHTVERNNSRLSEPMYVGGDALNLFGGSTSRASIVNTNATWHILDDIAFTNLDFLMPNYEPSYSGTPQATWSPYSSDNYWTTYYYGYAVDGSSDVRGRDAVFGTTIGSKTLDGTAIDKGNTSHLDVFQRWQDHDVAGVNAPASLSFNLTTTSGNKYINYGMSDAGLDRADIAGQASAPSIYMGHGSNLSIGVEIEEGDTVIGTDPSGYTFMFTETATFLIDGSHYYFGGDGRSETAHRTGVGGIFVEWGGKISITPTNRANMNMRVARSGNGMIDLPGAQVVFPAGMTPVRWAPIMATDTTLVPAGAAVAPFTLDWSDVTRPSTFTNYVPQALQPFHFADLADENNYGLPEIKSRVTQLEVLNSSATSPANIKIVGPGGRIDEIIFHDDTETSINCVVEGGRLGLGSTGTGENSARAACSISPNHIKIMANAEGGVVHLNSNLVVEDVGSIFAGSSFGSGEPARLKFAGDKELRVTEGSVLDLSTFSNDKQILTFVGRTKLKFEPGSALALGGGVLELDDDSQIIFEPIEVPGLVSGATVASTDDVRVKLVGTGTIRLKGASRLIAEDGAFVGVEAKSTYTPTTNLKFVVEDAAKIQIGDHDSNGGVLQVGNTALISDSTVGAEFELNGPGAEIQIGKCGFMGLGTGIISKLTINPAGWAFGSLFDVTAVTLDTIQGKFIHDRISDGDEASVLALSGATALKYTFTDSTDASNGNPFTDSIVRGGGNLLLLDNAVTSVTTTFTWSGADTDHSTGIMASGHALRDGAKTQPPYLSITGASVLDLLKVEANGVPNAYYGCFAPTLFGDERIAYVDSESLIQRLAVELVGSAMLPDAEESLQQGAVGIMFGYGSDVIAGYYQA